MKLIDSLARRLVGSTREPTQEDAQLEQRHAEAMTSLREATAHINGCRAQTLDDLEAKIDKSDGMMREALGSHNG